MRMEQRKGPYTGRRISPVSCLLKDGCNSWDESEEEVVGWEEEEEDEEEDADEVVWSACCVCDGSVLCCCVSGISWYELRPLHLSHHLDMIDMEKGKIKK